MISKYPLDYDELKKGDILTTETLERITEVPHSDQLFSLKCLALCGDIEKNRKRSKEPLLCRMKSGQLIIMQDVEADAYLEGEGRQTVARLVRLTQRMTYVSTNTMSDAERRLHESRMRLLQLTSLAAVGTLRKELVSVRAAKKLLGSGNGKLP